MTTATEDFDLFHYLAQCGVIMPQSAPISMQIRRARNRDYFVIQQGQALMSEPYKYNIRMFGAHLCKILHFELFMLQTSNGKYEHMERGIEVEKQVVIRGAPKDTVDFRIQFQVKSSMYFDKPFTIVVKNEYQQVLCTSNLFFLK